MRVKYVGGSLAGVAEKPFTYEREGEKFEVEEPTIFIGRDFIEGKVEGSSFGKVASHERYHAVVSPRSEGGWAGGGKHEGIGRLEDEIEAMLFSEMASGERILGDEVSVQRERAEALGIAGNGWKDLVKACAARIGYSNSLGEWW